VVVGFVVRVVGGGCWVGSVRVGSAFGLWIWLVGLVAERSVGRQLNADEK
jgi:hypothetical protein